MLAIRSTFGRTSLSGQTIHLRSNTRREPPCLPTTASLYVGSEFKLHLNAIGLYKPQINSPQNHSIKALATRTWWYDRKHEKSFRGFASVLRGMGLILHLKSRSYYISTSLPCSRGHLKRRHRPYVETCHSKHLREAKGAFMRNCNHFGVNRVN